MDLLPFIFNKYGSLGAWILRDKTHNESPWKNAYSPCLNNEISQDSLEEYFTSLFTKEATRLKNQLEKDEEINNYGFI